MDSASNFGPNLVEPYAPYNFSWVVKDELAAMGCPQTEANMEYLAQQGIKHLVTLSNEKIPPINQATSKFEWTLIPVKNFEAPTIENIIKFIEICQRCHLKNQAVGVHCRMGRGRTGVMAACYLVRFQGLAPERAITNIRLMRPASVETPEQERAVLRYHDCLKGTQV